MDESLSDDNLLSRQFMRAHERFYNFGYAQIIRSKWCSGLDTELVILGKGFESAHSLFFLQFKRFPKTLSIQGSRHLWRRAGRGQEVETRAHEKKFNGSNLRLAGGANGSSVRGYLLLIFLSSCFFFNKKNNFFPNYRFYQNPTTASSRHQLYDDRIGK